MGERDLGHQPRVERRPAVTSPALAFVRGIAARHRRGRFAAAPVPRIGLRPVSAGNRPVSVRLDVRVAQRLGLDLRRSRTMVLVSSPRPLAPSAGTAAVRIVERIVSSSVRSDGPAPAVAAPRTMRPAVGAGSPDPVARPVPTAVPPPVNRVLRRLESPSTSPPAASSSLTAPPAAAPAVLGAAELERVTSHVVDTLDRRVSAWRERRGRV